MAEPTHAEQLAARHARLTTLLETETDGSKAAALSRELRALDAELAQFSKLEMRSTVDDLATRRAHRISGAPGTDAPKVRERGGRRGGDRAR